MGDMIAGLFGGGGAERRAAQLQKEQREDLEREKARLARVEEGRNKLRSSRRGLLAFSDDDPTVTDTLGGATEAVGNGRRRRRPFGSGAAMGGGAYAGVDANE